MRKSSLKIRAEIAGLQDALRAAETWEAERIGRIALKAGLGEIEIEDGELQTAFEHVAMQFRNVRGKREKADGKDREGTSNSTTSILPPGTSAGRRDEA